MSLSRRSLRHRVRGSTLHAVFLGATIGLAGWLAYQAVDAARSHRRTAEAVLDDYAQISAWEFSRTLRSNLDHMLEDVFRPVRRRMRGSLPDAAVVGWELDDAARERGCRCPAFRRPLLLFRLRPSPRAVDAVPDSLPPDRLGRLADLVLSQPVGDGRVDRGIFMAPAGTVLHRDVAVGFMLSHDSSTALEVAYGFVVPVEAVGELFSALHGDGQLLPAPVAGDQPNDSLLFVRVHDGAGTTVFQSPARGPDRWSAAERVGPGFGSLTVEATVRPEAAGRLVIGGLPTSRLPLLVVLLLLTGAMGVAAFVQLRREQRFERLRDDFVSGVSHELRTPLAQIQMFSELQMGGMLPSSHDRERAVKVIHREARRLSHLVENILQFTRLGRTSGLGLPKEDLDFADACTEGVDAVTPLLEDRRIELSLDREDGLVVRANRDAVTRIVVNLLDNAVKYGPVGQTVQVSIRGRNGVARLSVADQGTGRAAGRPGPRMEAVSPSAPVGRSRDAGYGHRSFGRVAADGAASGSRLGRGRARRWGAIRRRDPSRRWRERPRGEPMSRVLIIEDNSDLAFGLQKTLEFEGYEVLVAETGELGLERARRDAPDLVVLDVMLPGMDGFGVLREIRAGGARVPVLMLTARDEEADVVLGFHGGADDYVTKPFSTLELVARVQALLRRSSSGGASVRSSPWSFGDVEVDAASRTVRRAGADVSLTPKEFDLLEALLRRDGAAASRAELLEEVWHYANTEVATRTVDIHVAELRRKLEVDPSRPRHILTVRKVGYRLEA